MPVVTILKERGRGIEFSIAILKERYNMVGFIFVDDIDISKGKLHNSNFTIYKVFKRAQKAIDY